MSRGIPTEAGTTGGEIRRQRVRRDLRIIIQAWVFGSLWMWTINGATMTRFAKALGTPDWGFGVLAALPFVGTLFQLPASYYLERYGHRRRFFLIAATLHRLMWGLIAAVPWVPGIDGYRWQVMAGLLFVNWTAASASGPAWFNWMADVIPRKVRGRYFGIRNRIGMSIGLCTTLAIGYVLDLADFAEHQPGGAGTVLKVTSVMLAIAGLFGTLDIQLFRRVGDDHPPPKRQVVDLLAMLRVPLADRNFRRFLAYNFTLTLAVAFIGQYVWLYVFDVVGMSNKQANLLIIAMPLLMQLIAYPIWGGLMDRLGKKPVMLICGTMVITGSLGWLFLGQDAAADINWGGGMWQIVIGLTGWNWGWTSWLGYGAVLLTTFAWPGVEVANFNLILDMSSPHRPSARKMPSGGRGGTAYVAVNSLVVAVAGILSGLLAIFVAAALKPLMTEVVHFAGMTLSYHAVLFAVSTVLRAVAVLLAMGLHEPTAVGTRAALQFMTGLFYSNVREAVTLPTRIMGQASRWSFLMSVPWRKRFRFGDRPEETVETQDSPAAYSPEDEH
ncbi:MAG: MFS transporter [Phycisphaeraceae bacterium]